MNESPQDERDWQALQYVLGELSADEEARFEKELEADQSLREVVARSVELSDAMVRTVGRPVEVVPAVPLSRRDGRRALRQAFGWMSLGATACLAGITIWAQWSDEGGERPAGGSATSGSVAIYWSELRSEESREDSAMAGVLEESDTELGLLVREGEDLPQWLLAAAAVEDMSETRRNQD